MIAGVDEAGRGCVIGPLVICAYACGDDDEKKLRELGARDSKELSDSAREKAAEKLRPAGEFATIEISPEEITEYMAKKISLNEMEAEKIVEGLKLLGKKTGNVKTERDGKNKEGMEKISKVFVDSPDPNPEKFEKRIRKYLRTEGMEIEKIISENKADSKYACVGAASIIAKSLREKRIEEIKKEIGIDFGSGYTSDERTIRFLKEHVNDKNLQKHIRHRWETIRRLKETKIKLSDFV